MQKEEEYQALFKRCLRDLREHDQTYFLTYGFNALLSNYIPSIISKNEVESYNTAASWSDCFDFGLTKITNITGLLKLEVVPLLAPPGTKGTLLSSVRTVIAQLPLPTGRTNLYHAAFDDADLDNRYLPTGAFVCQSKMRSLPPVKNMINNRQLLFIKKDYFKLQVRSCDLGVKPFRSTSTIEFIIFKTPKKSKKNKQCITPEAKSMISEEGKKVQKKSKKIEGFITCNLPFSTTNIHVGILAFAFGCPPLKFISLVKAVAGHMYEPAIFRAYEINLLHDEAIKKIQTQEAAIAAISHMFGRDQLSTGINQLKTEVFPHINVGFRKFATTTTDQRESMSNNNNSSSKQEEEEDEQLQNLVRIVLRSMKMKNTQQEQQQEEEELQEEEEDSDKQNIKNRSSISSSKQEETLAHILNKVHARSPTEDDCEKVTNVEGLYRAKLLYLAKCVSNIILLAAGKISDTCRDWLSYSSMTSPAHFIGFLFRQTFITHMRKRTRWLKKSLKKLSKKNPEEQNFLDLVKLYGESAFSAKIRSAMMTGTWSAKKKGVSLTINTGNMEGFVGQLLRISSSLHTTDAINTSARDTQFDGFGLLCGATTPDGAMAGLVMEMATLASLTSDVEYPNIISQLIESIFQKEFFIPVDAIMKKTKLGTSMLPLFLLPEEEVIKVIEVHHHDHNKHTNKSTDYNTIRPDYYLFYNNCGIPTHFILESKIGLFIQRFRQYRRCGDIPRIAFLQVFHKRHEVHVICEGGQLIRPLVVVENMHLAKESMSYQQMLELGVVEFLNAAEIETTCKIAYCYESYLSEQSKQISLGSPITHIEICQDSLISRLLSRVPFATSLQGARDTYVSQQIRQWITAEPKHPRGSILTTQLHNSCRSLVTTQSELDTPNPSFNSGCCVPVVVAFIPMRDAQEDSFAVNEAAIQRGLLDISVTRIYSTDEALPKKKYRERVEKRLDIPSRKNLDYSTVENHGLPKLRTFIPGGGIVIAKNRTTEQQLGVVYNNNNNSCKTVQEEKKKQQQYDHLSLETRRKTNKAPKTDAEDKNNKTSSSQLVLSEQQQALAHNNNSSTVKTIQISTKTTDISITTRRDESGQVTRIQAAQTPFGNRYSVHVTKLKSMEDGDKGTTMHSQKGVQGRKIPQADMPFCEITGIVPDIVFAPLGVISRMLMASLIEVLTGKAVALDADLDLGVDKQLYNRGNEEHVKKMADILVKHGFRRTGKNRYRDGRTGRLLEGDTFDGIIPFFRLLHLARKKIHARDIGPRELLTRQPCEGRRKGGGLRYGSMEGAATCSYGAAHILQARFKQWSDPFPIHVCARCKMPADGNEEINYAWCRLCRSREHIRLINMPFTFLLTMWDLMAMGIVVRIALQESDLPSFGNPMISHQEENQIDDDTREHWIKLFEEENNF